MRTSCVHESVCVFCVRVGACAHLWIDNECIWFEAQHTDQSLARLAPNSSWTAHTHARRHTKCLLIVAGVSEGQLGREVGERGTRFASTSVAKSAPRRLPLCKPTASSPHDCDTPLQHKHCRESNPVKRNTTKLMHLQPVDSCLSMTMYCKMKVKFLFLFYCNLSVFPLDGVKRSSPNSRQMVFSRDPL